MVIKTRIFELYSKKYGSLTELAEAMDLSLSQLYRVRMGTRGINQKFIIGAKKAFPDYKLDDLFYLDNEKPGADSQPDDSLIERYRHIVRSLTA